MVGAEPGIDTGRAPINRNQEVEMNLKTAIPVVALAALAATAPVAQARVVRTETVSIKAPAPGDVNLASLTVKSRSGASLSGTRVQVQAVDAGKLPKSLLVAGNVRPLSAAHGGPGARALISVINRKGPGAASLKGGRLRVRVTLTNDRLPATSLSTAQDPNLISSARPAARPGLCSGLPAGAASGAKFVAGKRTFGPKTFEPAGDALRDVLALDGCGTANGTFADEVGETPPGWFTLTITKSGTGTGTVAGGGIDCGGTCSLSYPPGSRVGLAAIPDRDSLFVDYSSAGGAPCDPGGYAGPLGPVPPRPAGSPGCNVTVNADMTVDAQFKKTTDQNADPTGGTGETAPRTPPEPSDDPERGAQRPLG
jgi:hypothetical protein